MNRIRPSAMRPISSTADEERAFDIFFSALYDDPDHFHALSQGGIEPNAIGIAEDCLSAEFEIYPNRENWWETTRGRPIALVVVEDA